MRFAAPDARGGAPPPPAPAGGGDAAARRAVVGQEDVAALLTLFGARRRGSATGEVLARARCLPATRRAENAEGAKGDAAMDVG